MKYKKIKNIELLELLPYICNLSLSECEDWVTVSWTDFLAPTRNFSFHSIYNPPETKSVKQLVNGNEELVSKAARVQPKHLPASPHPQLTGTLGAAADDGHIVYALAVSWHKGDAGRPLGYVVHGLSYHGLVLRWK